MSWALGTRGLVAVGALDAFLGSDGLLGGRGWTGVLGRIGFALGRLLTVVGVGKRGRISF
jgi:hypothetical protein